MVKLERNPEYFVHNIYSKWHRTLSEKCFMYNLDAVEVRNGNIVAIIEVKTQYPNKTVVLHKYQADVFNQIAKSLNVPFYFIRIYTDEKEEEIKFADIYQMYPVITDGRAIKEKISEKELRKFIESL